MNYFSMLQLYLGDFIICMWAFFNFMRLVVEYSFGTLA